MEPRGGLGGWLEERCKEEGLSLRQAATKTGLSHATISDIRNGAQPSAETIKKLAAAYSDGDGHHKKALEDRLLILSGYRSERTEGEISEPIARLMDKLSQFSEPQLKVMERFADFVSEMGEK